VLLFVGRIQPLKAPDVLLRAAARLVTAEPTLRDRLHVVVVGGPSGSGLAAPEQLQKLAGDLGIADITHFVRPVNRDLLVDYYRAATVTVVPSHTESFGLVAVESQACGTPVVAASVGGLQSAVADKRSGILIDGHDPAHYADAITRIVHDVALHRRLAEGAVAHAAHFGWAQTAAGVLGVYAEALTDAVPRIAAAR
jgi:D-inositol-3-phosphate glycosyltransferase